MTIYPMKTYCGIDVGFTGALAFVHAENGVVAHVNFYDMPLTKDRKGRSLIDCRELSDIIINENPFAIAHEIVASMPRQGVASMFRFGEGFGAVQAVLALSGLPFEGISPNVWKKRMKVAGEKDFARTQAINRYPQFTMNALARKKDSGRADAFWIAMALMTEREGGSK